MAVRGCFVLFATLFFSPLTTTSRQKYSIEKNAPPIGPKDSLKPFRMNKINVLWEKAMKNSLLDPEKLEDLRHALATHDEREIKYKHARVNENYDADGEIVAELQRNFNAIILEFGIKEKLVKVLTPVKKGNAARDDFNEVRPTSKADPSFGDVQVDRLWKEASRSGFSEQEMDVLKTEFDHLKNKEDALNLLLEDAADEELLSNGIPKDDILRKEKMKRQVLSTESTSLNPEDFTAPVCHGPDVALTEPRVLELWSRAQRAEFTPKQLVSLKEELCHFQRKIAKRAWMSAMAEAIEADVKMGKTFDADQHREIRQREKELGAKIAKLESHFGDKIGARDASEL